ncbi:MAG: SDR family oxidoreductase [Chloroflexota bacterium]|nr:SDR family oxidoreductase [Chloroflexota bacterium]
MTVPDYNFSKKVVLITGASSGIGLHLSKCFAEAGARVAVMARSKDKLYNLCAEIAKEGGEARPFPADVQDESLVESQISAVVHRFGKLNIIVHCAGITRKGFLQDLSTPDWDAIIDTNLKSAYYLAKHSHYHLHDAAGEEHSKFILIGSVGSFFGIPLSAAYCASKGGLVQLMRSLAVEWAEDGINVNAICPGYILTPLSESVLKIGDTYKKVASRIPMRKIGNTSDIANAALFFCSPMADYIQGATLNVDGGLMSAAYTLDE